MFQVLLLLVEKLQIIAVLSPALHFPWLSLKEHFPALPAPSTTFVTGRNNQTAQVFLRWVVDLTWILDLKLFKHVLWMSQSWTPYQSLHGIHLKYFKFPLTLLSALSNSVKNQIYNNFLTLGPATVTSEGFQQ